MNTLIRQDQETTMSTDLATIDHTPERLPARIEHAKALAASDLLPKQYRNNPANVLIAIEFGHALGISPIQAMNDIHVIEGKPSASANVISALVRRAGHKLRVKVSDEHLVALAQIIRADDPDYVYEARWDMKKAQTAGLTGNPNWKKHPGQMLRNRAITEVARMGASDALYGVQYSTEELEDVKAEHVASTSKVTAADITGEVVEPVTVEAEIMDAETGELPIEDPPADWPEVAPIGVAR